MMANELSYHQPKDLQRGLLYLIYSSADSLWALVGEHARYCHSITFGVILFECAVFLLEFTQPMEYHNISSIQRVQNHKINKYCASCMGFTAAPPNLWAHFVTDLKRFYHICISICVGCKQHVANHTTFFFCRTSASQRVS